MLLQLLLRKKAAEELKKEQERKAAERRRIIEERCGKPKNVEDANEGECRGGKAGFVEILGNVMYVKTSLAAHSCPLCVMRRYYKARSARLPRAYQRVGG